MGNIYEAIRNLSEQYECLRKEFNLFKKAKHDNPCSDGSVIFNGDLWGNEHTSSISYYKNTQVKVTDGDVVKLYIAKKNVPVGVSITNTEYWTFQYLTISNENVLEVFETQTIISPTPPVGIAPEGTEWIMYKD